MAIGSRPKTVDVYIQDQYSETQDIFATQKLGVATLSAPTTIGSKTIALETGHGFVAGNMVEIYNEDTLYQSRVLSAATNSITVTVPVTRVFGVTDTVRRVSHNMNVDGSVTPVTFTICPPPGVHWDMNILAVNMLDNVEMDDGKFGGILALTNGVLYSTVNAHITHIFTALDNGCYIRHCDTEDPYSPRAPAGLFGFNCKRYFNGQQGDGVTQRLGGEECAEFQIIVQDNLVDLTRFWNVLRGHRVINPVPGDKTRMTIGTSWTPITAAGQIGVMWLMHDTEMLVTSSTNGSPSDTTAYPLYRGKILPLEPDSSLERFYARAINAPADIVVDILG